MKIIPVQYSVINPAYEEGRKTSMALCCIATIAMLLCIVF